MPLYEYQCRTCGSQFEELTGADGPCPVCPACGGKDVVKLMSAASLCGHDAGGFPAGAPGGFGGPGGCGGGGFSLAP